MTDRAVPVLPSADLERTANFFGYFGFEVTGRENDGYWLRLASGPVELEFHHTDFDWNGPDMLLADRLCVIRVADAAAWHARFAESRMRWKAMGHPSLTAVRDDLWGGRPAFNFKDRDGNFFWVVQD